MNRITKVRIDLADQDGAPAGELIWAEELGKGLYRLQNLPCFAMGLSTGDIVRCELGDDVPSVCSLEQDNGFGLVRVYFCGPERSWDTTLVALRELGCSYERGSFVFMFSVPNTTDLDELATLLNEADEVEAWEFAKMPLSTVS